ncbi:ImmA/IrrE family metallo-endopeptidase [Eubacterium limosum]|uniref:ImmA/IrrE family metallo-endopeptidase n=1 Tax=Eubacterium limosum TaxID=1736 RepID=UPI003722AF17
MKDIIRKIVKKYGTNDPFELADCLGAITITAPLKDGTRGFYDYYKRNGIICIDENLSDEEARMVCAHELGHFILHRKVNSVLLKNTTLLNTNRYEIEANRFAAYLLIPTQYLMEYAEYGYTIDQLACIFRVSREFMELRFR